MKMTKYEHFAKAMVETGTIAAAGKECKISSATAYRWSKRPEVVEAMRAIKKAKMAALSAYITKASSIAMDTIMDIIKDHSVNSQTRLQASMFVVKTGYERLDLDEIAKRVDSLEELVKQSQ